MKITHTLAALIATSIGAQAAITLTGDSSTFDYKYEMSVNPATQDLDVNGAVDWFPTAASGSIVPTVSGGFANSNQTTNPKQNLFRGDFAFDGNASIWREVVSAGAAADWTLEIKFSKVSGTQGANGWFGIATANSGESNSSALTVLDDRIRLTGGADYMVGTDFTAGAQTIRIAHDAGDNQYYYWINDVLLNADLSTPIAGTNGSVFDNNIFIGNYTGSLAGEWQIDYLRIDNDAIGVVPESSAIVLLGLGGLALIRRRR